MGSAPKNLSGDVPRIFMHSHLDEQAGGTREPRNTLLWIASLPRELDGLSYIRERPFQVVTREPNVRPGEAHATLVVVGLAGVAGCEKLLRRRERDVPRQPTWNSTQSWTFRENLSRLAMPRRSACATASSSSSRPRRKSPFRIGPRLRGCWSREQPRRARSEGDLYGALEISSPPASPRLTFAVPMLTSA